MNYLLVLFPIDEAEEFNNEWRNKAQNLNLHRSRYLPYTPR